METRQARTKPRVLALLTGFSQWTRSFTTVLAEARSTMVLLAWRRRAVAARPAGFLPAAAAAAAVAAFEAEGWN